MLIKHIVVPSVCTVCSNYRKSHVNLCEAVCVEESTRAFVIHSLSSGDSLAFVSFHFKTCCNETSEYKDYSQYYDVVDESSR